MTNGTRDFTRVLARSLHRLFPTTRRARRGLALCSLLVLAPAAFISLPASRAPESACESLKRWASRYAGSSPTLDEIAPFTRAQRIAIFNAVTPPVRASLWQEQLRRFNQQTDLTSEQHALVAEGLRLTTPALYAQEPRAMDAHKTFWDRAKTSFTSTPHRRALAELGSLSPVAMDERAAATSWMSRVSRPFSANAAFGSCDCQAPIDTWTCPGGTCVGGGCSTTASGCGVNWTRPCSGICNW